MTLVTNLNSAALAIKDFEGVPKEGEPLKASYVVILDMATVLAGELAATRAKYARKLTALVRPGDKLTLWFSRGENIYGEFCAEELITEPSTQVADLIDRYMVEENFRGGSEPLEDMAGAAASLVRNARKEKRSLLGYTFIDGFAHTTVFLGMACIAQFLTQDCDHFFVGEYSTGEEISEAWLTFIEAVGLRCVYSRDLLDTDTSFETAIASIAGYSPRLVSMKDVMPEDEYGFLTFLVGDRVMAVAVDDEDVALLPAGTKQFGYFSDELTPQELDFYPQLDHSPLFWATLALSPALDEDLDFMEMLLALGDVHLLNMFSMGIEGGDLHRYELACMEAAFNPNCRYKQGMSAEVAMRARQSPEDIEHAREVSEAAFGEDAIEEVEMPGLLQPWVFAVVLGVFLIGGAFSFFG